MEALTAMGFPEHMCAKAMRMTGGDVEAAANYIMGALATAQPPLVLPPPHPHRRPLLGTTTQQPVPLTAGARRQPGPTGAVVVRATRRAGRPGAAAGCRGETG